MAQPESFAKCVCQHCGGHIEFPVEGAGQKISCPHCQWETVLSPAAAPVEIGGGRGTRKRIYLTFAICACGVAVAGLGVYLYLQSQNAQQQANLPVPATSSSNVPDTLAVVPPASAHKAPPDPWHGLKPSKVLLEKAGNTSLVYAIGTLTNDTKRQRFGVKVELEIQDVHRNKLGSATDYTEVIEPGKEWNFRALVTAKTAIAAKLTSVKEQQ